MQFLHSVLIEFPEDYSLRTCTAVTGQVIDVTKLKDRYYELLEEFLQPYVMDTTSKED